MSAGDMLLMFLFVIPVATLAALFLATLAALVVSAIHDLLGTAGVPPRYFWGALTLALALAFFVWFVCGSPGMERFEHRKPHAVEGREEWIDAREGTNYSQVERRTDD